MYRATVSSGALREGQCHGRLHHAD